MSRKRDKPYFSRHDRFPAPKRRRPPPLHHPSPDELDRPATKPHPPPAVAVLGLPWNCSVLDLKSRFEIYGEISRIRIDRDVGFIMFRTKDSAEAAITAALDASFGITIDSQKVQVLWATDPLARWREGIGARGDKNSVSSSKLLRAEIPLSRRGRGNKLASAILNPRSSNKDASSSALNVPFKGREIVAYDDIL